MEFEIWMIIAPIAAILALGYALIAAFGVKKAPEGTDKMKEIAASIRKGASAYLKRQYKTVGVFFVAVFVVLLVLAFVPGLELVSKFTPFAFLTGGIFSGLAGFVGMNIAVTANSRTACAAEKSLNSGLKVAFKAGSVMGFTVVGLGLLDFSIWYFMTKYAFGLEFEALTNAMVTFGIGASSMALFARVGGGIFTKAADVGADLVGKVEAGIPEDDPRNPAVIADNVGDNVGDVAGMGADLYESYVGSIISACALGVAALGSITAMALPMLLAAIGIVCSIFGTFLVRTKEGAEILYCRQRLVTAARACGVDVYDTPFTDVEDIDGLYTDARFAKALGFTGKVSISPRHVEGINEVFSPTKAEIEYAHEVLDIIEEAKRMGRGVVSLRGKMIDAPIVNRAKQVIEMEKAIYGGTDHE